MATRPQRLRGELGGARTRSQKYFVLRAYIVVRKQNHCNYNYRRRRAISASCTLRSPGLPPNTRSSYNASARIACPFGPTGHSCPRLLNIKWLR